MPAVDVSSAPSRGQHVPALDGIRGVAILGVMLFHFYGPAGSWTTRVASYGALGVNLFFALSGFLITGILLDAKDRSNYFKNFYARRALRIWPLYYGTLFLLLVLVPLVHPVHDEKYRFSIDHQIWLWLYVNNFFEASVGRAIPLFGHFWSLAVEEQFYLVWPVVVLALSPRGLLWACAACALVSFFARLSLLLGGMEPELAIRVTFCQLDSLAVGAALVVVLRQGLAIETLGSFCRFALAPAAALTIAQLLIPTLNRHATTVAIAGTIWSLAFGGILVLGLGGQGPMFRRLFEARALRFMGKYSYGIYVFHWPIGRMFTAEFPGLLHPTSVFVALAVMLLQMIFSVVAALVSWNLFEKHFISLKRYFETSGA